MGSKRKRSIKKDEEGALRYVQRLLRYRLRSRKELEERLLREGFPEEVVERVLRKLEETGIIDDERFAYLFAHDELSLKFHGPYVIRRKLRALGVDEEIIEEALKKALEEVDMSEHVKRLFEKYGDVRKVREVLFQRGFDPSILENLDLR